MKKKIKGKKLLLIPLGILVISLILIIFTVKSKSKAVVISGEVDATQIDVSSKIPGRISNILVKRGDTVQKDQVLATILSPEMQAKLDQAKGAVESAKAMYQMAQKGARIQDKKAAYEMYEAAKAQHDFAEKTYNRMKSLYEKKSISKQTLDEVESKYLGAKSQMIAAQQKSDMAKEGARVEEIEAAKGNYDRALNALKEVESYMQELTVKSPVAGEISSIIADPGEVVAAGFPLITVTDLNDIWVVVYITEDLMPHVKKGSKFEVEIPALGKDKYSFQVKFISPMADFATKKATVETGGFDLKSFEVHLVPLKAIPDLRPGMTARIVVSGQ